MSFYSYELVGYGIVNTAAVQRMRFAEMGGDYIRERIRETGFARRVLAARLRIKCIDAFERKQCNTNR